MKNTKKVLATLALSATLAMGAVPAFAADAAVNKSGSFDTTGDKAGQGTTQLNVQATASQVQATLPIDITVVTPAKGGLITAPSANAYKIVNNNEKAPLMVTNIKGENANNWYIKTQLSTTSEGFAANAVGEMKLSVKAGASSAVDVTTAGTEIKDATAAYFTIPAKESLGLTLEGATAIADQEKGLSVDSPVKAAKIQYTVAAGSVVESE